MLIRIALPVAERDAEIAHSFDPCTSVSESASRASSLAGLLILYLCLVRLTLLGFFLLRLSLWPVLLLLSLLLLSFTSRLTALLVSLLLASALVCLPLGMSLRLLALLRLGLGLVL